MGNKFAIAQRLDNLLLLSDPTRSQRKIPFTKDELIDKYSNYIGCDNTNTYDNIGVFIIVTGYDPIPIIDRMVESCLLLNMTPECYYDLLTDISLSDTPMTDYMNFLNKRENE